jgi:hypothetical protein
MITSLLEPRISKFCRSNRFGTLAVRYEGKYYFLDDSQLLLDGRYAVQVVYKTYKWYQDTQYISSNLYARMKAFLAG